MNALLNLLIPYRNSREIDFRIKKQLPYLAITALFLLVAFMLLIFVILFSSDGKITLFIGAIATLIAILVVALVLLRNRRYGTSSRLISLILFAGSMAALYMMPYTCVPIEAYRPFAFMAVMSTCNIIIALEKKQIVAFYLGLIAGWSIAYMTIFHTHFSVDKPQTISILMVGLLGLSVANGVLYLLDTFSDELLENANTQMKGAQNAYSDLSKILMEARAGMSIGERILQASTQVQDALCEIEKTQHYLSSSSDSLLSESDNFSASSGTVLANVQSMKHNFDEQNSALTQTSASIAQISANLANISGIAKKRREMLTEISKAGTTQHELARKLDGAMQTVWKSSEGIQVFVHTVQDVASKTGLLAMNASIEAARAGSAGKGFAVIAQEVRILSTETQKTAETIKNLLAENEKTVLSTNGMMKDFVAIIEKNAKDTQLLTESIDEILQGIAEMDIGTREVMGAAQNIVVAAHSSGTIVNSVVSQVDSQKEGFAHIAKFSAELHERIAQLEQSVREIRLASDLVAEAGRQNTEQAQKLQHIR